MLKKIMVLLATLIIVTVSTFASAGDEASKPSVVAEPPKLLNSPLVTELATAPIAAKGLKMGYVDIVRVGNESDQAVALQGKLEKKKKELQGKIDSKRKQLEKQRAALEKKAPSMTQAERGAEAKKFQKKVEEFQNTGKKLEEEMFKLQESETKALFNSVEVAAANYGKQQGYNTIVIKKELLYIGEGVDASDVTDQIIKAMNEARKK